MGRNTLVPPRQERQTLGAQSVNVQKKVCCKNSTDFNYWLKFKSETLR
jgi:hypothetical protein